MREIETGVELAAASEHIGIVPVLWLTEGRCNDDRFPPAGAGSSQETYGQVTREPYLHVRQQEAGFEPEAQPFSTRLRRGNAGRDQPQLSVGRIVTELLHGFKHQRPEAGTENNANITFGVRCFTHDGIVVPASPVIANTQPEVDGRPADRGERADGAVPLPARRQQRVCTQPVTSPPAVEQTTPTGLAPYSIAQCIKPRGGVGSIVTAVWQALDFAADQPVKTVLHAFASELTRAAQAASDRHPIGRYVARRGNQIIA